MALFKINKTKNYTVMSNYHLRDKNLSLKAKGLLSLMLSLPEDWDYSIQGLVQIVQENETAVKSALNELMRTGYLVRLKLMPTKDENGNVIRAKIEYEYNIYEKPNKENCNQKVENQDIENQGVESLGVENQVQINKEVQSKENKKETVSKDTAKKAEEIEIENAIVRYTGNEEVRKILREFVEYRRNKRSKMSFKAFGMMLNKLRGFTEEEQIDAIETSIVSNWDGVFPKHKYNKQEPVQEKHNVAHKPSEYEDFDIKEYYKGLRK